MRPLLLRTSTCLVAAAAAVEANQYGHVIVTQPIIRTEKTTIGGKYLQTGRGCKMLIQGEN